VTKKVSETRRIGVEFRPLGFQNANPGRDTHHPVGSKKKVATMSMNQRGTTRYQIRSMNH
jgi:hypothetical protein